MTKTFKKGLLGFVLGFIVVFCIKFSFIFFDRFESGLKIACELGHENSCLKLSKLYTKTLIKNDDIKYIPKLISQNQSLQEKNEQIKTYLKTLCDKSSPLSPACYELEFIDYISSKKEFSVNTLTYLQNACKLDDSLSACVALANYYEEKPKYFANLSEMMIYKVRACYLGYKKFCLDNKY